MTVKLKKIKGKELLGCVPVPANDADKYTRGRLVVVGGSASYPGAACLASKAAYMVGAGYVEVVCAPESLPVVHSYNPNVVARPWKGWTAAGSKLEAMVYRHPCACLIGSGFDGDGGEEGALFKEVLKNVAYPVVVDGGAITALATNEGRSLATARGIDGHSTIVTPHFGEAARLAAPLKIKAPANPGKDLEEDARYAQQLADAYSATVVLKGSNTFIASPHDPGSAKKDVVRLMDKGTAALAKAGTGDVLAGVVSGLAAQRVEPLVCATLGTTLHALAGRMASSRLGEVSVCATDVAEALPEAVSTFLLI